ncbi:MAG: undecaprenyldiphospho-muramoylpentapeptide beta-N-acetylglucosaminyltransferase [Planctomycetaceae bacterium]|nr:undecaprenyldiphospho-muramoylpentapeptide beta-N-acetylglucosaminyltransferase [Planctomycetaceae bacterium]
MDTFVFAGGGTGGHLFPAIAVARRLRSRVPDARIVFVGGSRPVEGDILSRELFERRQLAAAASTDLKRNPLRFAWRHWQARRTATAWLKELQPRAVIGCGGYVSVPVALAANRARVPVVLLEQNVIPGRATSWLARHAQTVCMSFEETAQHLPRGVRTVVTGNPVRDEIAALATLPGPPRAGRRTLLILGGSQGAASINEAILLFAERNRAQLAHWHIVHQTGPRDEAGVRERYSRLSLNAEVAAFFVDMAGIYVRADLAVSRAGATSLAELACAGLPAVCVPYPGAVRDHQRHNAQWYERRGAAVCVADGEIDELQSALQPLLTDTARRQQMADCMRSCALPSATDRVLSEFLLDFRL